MQNKKGISDIISTVLIVLLALAAIAIVWGFIQPTLKGGGTAIDFRQKCIDAEVTPLSCDASAGNVTVQFTRGEISRITAILENSDGTTVLDTQNAPNLFGTTTHNFGDPTPIAAGETVVAAAVVMNDQGERVTCDPSPTRITCTN